MSEKNLALKHPLIKFQSNKSPSFNFLIFNFYIVNRTKN